MKVDRTIVDGEMISCEGMTLKAIYTPGHGRGSTCYFTTWEGKPVLFSGDTLLHYYKVAEGIYYDTGRTNFKDGTGNQEELYKNIREKLFILPEATIVFPGHYDYTTIGLEKLYSPAVDPSPRPTDVAPAADTADHAADDQLTTDQVFRFIPPPPGLEEVSRPGRTASPEGGSGGEGRT